MQKWKEVLAEEEKHEQMEREEEERKAQEEERQRREAVKRSAMMSFSLSNDELLFYVLTQHAHTYQVLLHMIIHTYRSLYIDHI